MKIKEEQIIGLAGPKVKARMTKASVRKTEVMELMPVLVSDVEAESVLVAANSLGITDGDVSALARGAFKEIGMENGEVTKRGMVRVQCAVKFLSGLFGGKKHKEAMKDSGLTWAQVSAFNFACPEFEKVYHSARGQMKVAMGMSVLDTAFELATEGAEVYNKDGESLGYKKRSEKMLDRLLTLAGKEFSKEAGKPQNEAGNGGGIVLNFHFDGKKTSSNVETINV